ncbi:MAG: hypothetical protein UMU04_07995 [Halanaerobiales bacterium]|jgi:hypothetical protein|nr:hypothetical protein [Halanaerobiales bacterium]
MTKNKKVEEQHELPYWEKEDPLRIRRGKFQLDYYDQAGRLNLKMTKIDEKGKIKTLKGVYLSKNILQENFKQLETLKTVFDEWYQGAKELQEAENA